MVYQFAVAVVYPYQVSVNELNNCSNELLNK